MTTDAQCPDGQECAHRCLSGCWRVVNSTRGGGQPWDAATRKAYGGLVQQPRHVPLDPALLPEGIHRRILDHITAHTTEHGYPPSVRQIGDAVGLTSTSSVAHQLQVMAARGLIRRDPGAARAITVLTAAGTRHCRSCTCPETPWLDGDQT